MPTRILTANLPDHCTGEYPIYPATIDLWHEDYGPVLWWIFPLQEPPYCGTPLDSDWPGYHTHWTCLCIPHDPTDREQRLARRLNMLDGCSPIIASKEVKEEARRITRRAIRAGVLVRPDNCSMCGGSDGVIEGHHPNHCYALDVVWLCRKCHYSAECPILIQDLDTFTETVSILDDSARISKLTSLFSRPPVKDFGAREVDKLSSEQIHSIDDWIIKVYLKWTLHEVEVPEMPEVLRP